MALELKIKQDIAAIDRHLFKTQTKTIKRAATSAINKVLIKVKTTASKEIREKASFKASEINKVFRVRRATWSRMTASITAPGYAPNLIRYKAVQTKKGVKASPMKKRHEFKGAFIANRGRTVFVRRGKERLPVKAVYGPSLKREFTRQVIKKAMDRRGEKEWSKEFDNQLKRLL